MMVVYWEVLNNERRFHSGQPIPQALMKFTGGVWLCLPLDLCDNMQLCAYDCIFCLVTGTGIQVVDGKAGSASHSVCTRTVFYIHQYGWVTVVYVSGKVHLSVQTVSVQVVLSVSLLVSAEHNWSFPACVVFFFFNSRLGWTLRDYSFKLVHALYCSKVRYQKA